MDMQIDGLDRIIARYLDGSISEKDKTILDEWVDSLEQDHSFDEKWSAGKELAIKKRIKARIVAEEKALLKPRPAKIISLIINHSRKFVAGAAVLLIMLSLGIYFTGQMTGKEGVSDLTLADTQDISPGGFRAKLTLSSGETVLLDEDLRGLLAREGYTEVTQQEPGLILYEPGSLETENLIYNTLVIPRGGHYQIMLADGTKVWLNAESSLRYPVGVGSGRRVVELSGEAYFEVQNIKDKPFVVMANGMEVEVLGTSFNIQAYRDEYEIVTTLLSGSVSVSSAGVSKVLSPGQQTVVRREDDRFEIYDATDDMERVLAWKNGLFMFERDDITSVMRQLSRWYDVDVIYENHKPDIRFGGAMQRNLTLSQVLNALEKSLVHFRVENRTIIVTSE